MDSSIAPWWGEYLAQYNGAARFVKGARVLDIGCRAGQGTRFLFDEGAVEVVGVDKNGEDILKAQRDNGRDGVSFVEADAKHLPFPPRSFDVITCFQVLESTTSCDQVLEQVKRLLVPSGTAVFTTANRRRESHTVSSPASVEHVQEFDRDEFKHLLKKNFASCEILGLTCRNRFQSTALQFLAQNKTLEFVRDQLENRIPWKLREVVSQRVFGTSYYPNVADYGLVDTVTPDVPLFFAVCRP